MAEQEILAPVTPEQPTVPEQVGEAPIQPTEVLPSTTPAAAPVVVTATQAPTTPLAGAPKDELLADIEEILQDDLSDIFETLPPTDQAEFKKEGEETAIEIHDDIAAHHFTARQTFKRIKRWLQSIPGINRFFLDQEAKIKTDDIVDLTERTTPPGDK